MKSKFFVFLMLAALMVITWPTQLAFGQLGFLSGSVKDSEGNPIKDAEIRIEGMNITKKYKLKTNSKGEYIHAGINLQGVYRIIAEKEGFQGDYVEGVRPGFTRNEERSITEFVLTAGQARTLAFEMTDEDRARLQQQQEEAAKQAEALEKVRDDFNQGVNFYNLGQYEEAAVAFKKVLDIDPGQSSVWANLGSSYMKLDRNEEAIEALNKAIELEPDNATYFQNLGGTYAALGQTDKARELYEKAAGLSAELNPSDAAVNYYNMGVTYINTGKNQEAAEALLKAIELDPNHAESHYQLGITMLGLGQMEDAIKYLQKYVEIDPAAVNAEVAKALIEQLSGN
ncbi:MAG: tetratricopeptide repeat protein [Acidobacteriota bacterium]|nr:MAG: tetratricopeptide repeat protein [Acidobacteriota bacterium]